MRKPILVVLIVAGFILVAAGSFYGGMVYGKQQANVTFTAGFPPANGQAVPFGGQAGDVQALRGQGQGGRFQGGAGQPGMTFGQIEAIDGNTLTITDGDGNPVKVQVADTTLIEKNASVSVTDLALGDTVIVAGNPNDDGSIAARSVQVAPAGRFFGANPGGPPADTQSGQNQ